MSRKLTFAIASTFILGFASAALAQEARIDRTPDHMLYYGPVESTAPQHAKRKTGEATAHLAPASQQHQYPKDPTPDHMLYYGPVQQ